VQNHYSFNNLSGTFHIVDHAASSSQDKILYQIKRSGPQTARDLGQHLGITTMAVRQHLSQLDQAGLVTTTPEESRGRGRPVRRWKLTEEGHGRFPDAHAQVTYDLIASVRELLGEDAMDQVIDKRTKDTFKVYQEEISRGASLEDRVHKLCELRTREGYMAESIAEDDGSFILVENHCPICVAARSCQGFCRSELEVFQKVFEGAARVSREDHILKGARRCSYRIEPVAD
jgi:predicted ArsR family transcriptional regulator